MLSSHIPTKVCKVRKTLPWITSDLLKLFCKRDLAFSQFKSTKSERLWSKYQVLWNKSVSAMRKAECEFLKSLSSLIKSPKQFWSLYYSLSPNKQRIPSILSDGTTTATSVASKANLLVSHFSACFSHVTPLDPDPDPDPNPDPDPDSPPTYQEGLSTITCSPDEVHKLLRTMKVKTASGPDGLSSHMLRNTASAIYSPLTDLFNKSLSSGVVPFQWKLSNITPVFKGQGNPSSVSNYRPISLLSLPSKVLERIIHNHLLNYLLSNNILSPHQFGFRPGSSTQEALLYATNDWHRHMDHGLSVASVFFDLSKAFDRVPHSQLISTLANIGVSGSLLAWFRSYLSNRSQRVVLDGHSSTIHPVTSGVPQGSILGPLLFSTYLNSLTNISLSRDSTLILYTDDIVLYRPIATHSDVESLQADVDKVSNWVRDFL